MQIHPGAPNVACVLVNWNNWQDTRDCLASLAAQDYPALTVIVVDNGSTNDSLAQLRAAHPWATYIDHGVNAGFPKACNLGARHPAAANADFIWLLNNDTVAPPGTTRKLVDQALLNPRHGITGAVLFYAAAPSEMQSWGGGSVSLWSGYNRHFEPPATFGPTAYITFACALIRRELFDQLNGLYEGVFMYFEDADFCLRAHKAGWLLTVASTTAILHKEGKAVRGRKPLLERIATTSGLVFLGRHAPVPAVAWLAFAGSRILRRLVARDWPSLSAVLHGIADWAKGRRTPFVD